MKFWITSDLHFGHQNIMKFCPVTRARFQNDVKRMDESMILEWNQMIAPDDLTYILGDVAFLPAEKATSILHRLNGQKILIEGNHDKKLLEDQKFRKCFSKIHAYLEMSFNNQRVVMFHYPIAEWHQMYKGAVHFHGHLHGGQSGLEKYRCLDVGMDATGAIAISLDTAIRSVLSKEIKKHHA